MTLLDHRNTATTKKLDFKSAHLTSVGARSCGGSRTTWTAGPKTAAEDLTPLMRKGSEWNWTSTQGVAWAE